MFTSWKEALYVHIVTGGTVCSHHDRRHCMFTCVKSRPYA